MPTNEQTKAVVPTAINDLTIKVVHDNNLYAQGFSTAWGFSASVTTPNKNVFFDTTGPWTKTGGAEPSDWPEWMRAFRDY